MQLTDLQLNRYLYKDLGGDIPDSSLMAYNVNTTDLGGGVSGAGGTPPANSVASGTIISSVILQSSPSSFRVEIDTDDVLRAYNNNVVILTIDRNGLNGSGAVLTTVNAGTLNVLTKFNYIGIPQPVLYSGNVNSATGVITFGPTGWTGARTGVGAYTITHGLGLSAPFLKVFGAQGSIGVIEPVVNQSNNFFTMNWYDTTGNPIDVNFTFLALRDLP